MKQIHFYYSLNGILRSKELFVVPGDSLNSMSHLNLLFLKMCRLTSDCISRKAGLFCRKEWDICTGVSSPPFGSFLLQFITVTSAGPLNEGTKWKDTGKPVRRKVRIGLDT